MAKVNEKKLKKIWGNYYGIKELPEGVFLKARGRIRLVSSESYDFSKKLKGVKSLGIAITSDDLKNFTIEGSRLFREQLSRNVIELSREQTGLLMKNGEVEFEAAMKKTSVAKSGSDYFGSVTSDGNKILTDLPRWRRIR